MSSEHDGFLVASYAQGLKEQLDSVRAELERVTRERQVLREALERRGAERVQAEADLSEALKLLTIAKGEADAYQIRLKLPDLHRAGGDCHGKCWRCREARLRERRGRQ